MKNIVVNECELSIAANVVQRNVDKLLDAISKYNASLARLQTEGIQDDVICAQFSAIAEDMAFCGKQLQTNISEIGTTVNKGIERVDEADAFKFPKTTAIDLVEQLLSAF